MRFQQGGFRLYDFCRSRLQFQEMNERGSRGLFFVL
jgi:hypothetical protein